MPSASVKPQLSEDRVNSVFPVQARVAIGLVLAFAVIAFVGPKLTPGPFVPHVTVVNHSDYSFNVAVSSTFSHDSMLLGTAPANGSTRVDTVYDQGPTWTFLFSTQGRAVGEVVLSRAALSSQNWRLVVPDRFASALEREGVVHTN